MPRKLKNNADWFIHDVTMSSNRKIVAIEARFGITGYALFNKFLEEFAGADHGKINYNDLENELLAGKFRVESMILRNYIDYCVNTIKIYVLENNILYYPKLQNRLEKLFEKREKIRERVKNSRNDKNEQNNAENNNNTLQSDSNALQSGSNALRYTDKNRLDKEEEYKYSSKEEVVYIPIGETSPEGNPPPPKNEILYPDFEEVKSFLIQKLPNIRDPDLVALNYYEKRKQANWVRKNGSKVINWQSDLIKWCKDDYDRINTRYNSNGAESRRRGERIYESAPPEAAGIS